MRTLSDVLRDADPLRDEPPRRERDRRLNREAILDTPYVPQWSRRSVAKLVIVAATLGGVAVGTQYWPRGASDLVAAVRFEVHLAEEQPANGLQEVTVDGRTIYLHPEIVVTNADIAESELVEADGQSFSVALTFTADGAAKMSRASQHHLGRPMAILIDGTVVMAPVIKAPMSTSATITGQFTREEAERIVSGIRGR
jgi:hypothetical protein